tara:strand:- start:662 stop:1000 length:339 start_codon:yes stop_codon:yes gene_type:complete
MKQTFYKRKIRSQKSKSVSILQKQFFKGIVLLISFCLIIIFVFGDHGIVKLYRIKNERKIIQKEISELRIQREKLENEKVKIESDLKYIEKIAREKYKMVKPGEKIFKVLNN